MRSGSGRMSRTGACARGPSPCSASRSSARPATARRGFPSGFSIPATPSRRSPGLRGLACPSPPSEAPPASGAQFVWRGLSLGGARVELEQDRLTPFGFPMDSAGVVQEGGKRSGIEASARVPLYFNGLYAGVSYQVWDKDAPDWRYLPDESWNGQLGYHRTFLATENFEIWTEIGVEGREPMVVPFLAPEDPGGDPPGEAEPRRRGLRARVSHGALSPELVLSPAAPRPDVPSLRADRELHRGAGTAGLPGAVSPRWPVHLRDQVDAVELAARGRTPPGLQRRGT